MTNIDDLMAAAAVWLRDEIVDGNFTVVEAGNGYANVMVAEKYMIPFWISSLETFSIFAWHRTAQPEALADGLFGQLMHTTESQKDAMFVVLTQKADEWKRADGLRQKREQMEKLAQELAELEK